MNEAEYDSLSPRQRECLRLIGRGFEAKEIALQLGISTGVVQGHILGGRGKLGNIRGVKAGRELLAFEAVYSIPGHLLPVPTDPETFDEAGTENAADVPMVVREPSSETDWPTPTKSELSAFSKGRTHDLSTLERVGWIIAIATGLAILGIAAFPLGQSAHRTARSVYAAATT